MNITQLKEFVSSEDASGKILLLSGIRGCGKTKLLLDYAKSLLEDGISSDNIIYYDGEAWRHEDPSFFETVKKRISREDTAYLLLDEISSVPEYEKAIAAFLFYPVRIILSTSRKLSDEFYTLFKGRIRESVLLPMSFSDFKSMYDGQIPEDSLFPWYCTFGGLFPDTMRLPAGIRIESRHILDAYKNLRRYCASSIVYDILSGKDAADYHTLLRILQFLSVHSGELHSPNSVAVSLTQDGSGKVIASRTAEKYIRLIEDSFFFHDIPRYDLRTRTMLKTHRKYYCSDPGLLTAISGFGNDSYDHFRLVSPDPDDISWSIASLPILESTLENVVFLEMIRRGYTVYTGKIGEKLIDFIGMKDGEKIYIQIAISIKDPLARVNELLPLRMITDNYEKMILTLDPDTTQSYEGIKVRNIEKWLREY